MTNRTSVDYRPWDISAALRSFDVAGLRELLASLGYETATRETGWHEHLLLRGIERWLGTGSTPGEALLHAVSQAFPSHAARELLRSNLDRRANVATEAPTHPVDAGEGDALVQPPPDRLPAPVVASADVDPAIVQPLNESQAIQAVAPPLEYAAREPEGIAQPTAKRTAAEAVATLGELQDEIDAAADELGMHAPIRQRAVMTGWVAEARSIEEDFPVERSVTDAVRRIVGTLGRLSKAWWPGSIHALALKARPSDASNDLSGDPVAATTWPAVAALAERTLERIESEALTRFDDYGWADAARAGPPPVDADNMLEVVAADIESVAEPLGIEPTSTTLPFPEQLIDWAAKLRWVRTHASDSRTWAAAIGRCRYWVSRRRSDFVEAERLLRPEFAPKQTWAGVLKLPVKPRVVSGTSTPSPPPSPLPTDATDADIVAWIAAELPRMGVHHASAVATLKPLAERVLAFDSSRFAALDRHDRRRWQKLRTAIANHPADVPNPATGTPAEKSAPVDERVAVVDVVRLSVIAKTRGKRALLVTNCDDVMLRDRLRDELEFGRVEYLSAEPRRIQSSADAITSGRFEIVLGATGFLRHSTDGAIHAACQRAGIPYVRVAKGRPATCVRALAKMYGFA